MEQRFNKDTISQFTGTNRKLEKYIISKSILNPIL